MPKNLKGGSHHKKMASKDTKSSSMFKMRYVNPNEPSEMYAKVTNVYGGGMLEVMCNDGVRRLCVIRRKFKGRNKRDNQISINSVLIVGLREWEVVQKGKKEKVDLLYVGDNLLEYLTFKKSKYNLKYITPTDMINEILSEQRYYFLEKKLFTELQLYN